MTDEELIPTWRGPFGAWLTGTVFRFQQSTNRNQTQNNQNPQKIWQNNALSQYPHLRVYNILACAPQPLSSLNLIIHLLNKEDIHCIWWNVVLYLQADSFSTSPIILTILCFGKNRFLLMLTALVYRDIILYQALMQQQKNWGRGRKELWNVV